MRPMIFVSILALAACTTAGERMTVGDRASARLVDPTGADRGTATISGSGSNLRVEVSAKGMSPGLHALHVHQFGRCDAPGFESAGEHWNPTGRQHGRDNPAGAHAGDIPNIMIGSDGTGRASFDLAGRFSGGADALLDGDGAALIIHAGADDYRTDPSGNSGGRIACGVLSAG